MPIEKAQEQWNQPQPMEYVPATRVALHFGRAVFVIVHQYGLSILIIVFMLLTALKIYNLMIWGNSWILHKRYTVFPLLLYCIPAVTRKVPTRHILLTIIGYLCLIRRRGYNFSLISKITFFQVSSFHLYLHLVSLVRVGIGKKKICLPNPQSEDEQQWVPEGDSRSCPHAVSLSFSSPAQCQQGFMVAYSSSEDKHNDSDPPAYFSSGFSLWILFLVSEISICYGMIQHRIYPIIKANLSDFKSNFYFLIQPSNGRGL